MKKNIIILFLGLILSTQNVNSQNFWYQSLYGVSSAVSCFGATTSDYIFAGRNFSAGGGTILITTNYGINWVTSYNVSGSIDVFCTNNSGDIFFGASDGVYISTNSGNNWQITSLHENIRIMTIYQNVIIAASPYTTGVFRTTNNGINWESINNGLTTTSFYSVCVDSSGNIYLGSQYGVFRSINSGNSWEPFGLVNYAITAMAVLNDGSILSGCSSGVSRGIFKSTNNGNSWFEVQVTSSSVSSFVINKNGQVFAGTLSNGVYTSLDIGLSWYLINSGLTNLSVGALGISKNGYVFAGTNLGSIYRSIESTTGVIKTQNTIPNEFSLSQNYPNPFNPTTKIKFDIPAVGNNRDRSVKLIIYDILGREVTTLVNEALKPGSYEAEWDGSNFASGLYFYKLQVHLGGSSTGDYSETKKMVLIK